MSKRIAIITGVSRGLGLVLAKEFAGHDWSVVGTGRSPRPTDLPQAVAYHQFDASDATACEKFWKALSAEHAGASFCLVNNAGGYVHGGLKQALAEDFAQQMNSIYFSAVYMTRGLALVAEQARVINIISASALAAHKNNAAYGAAKAAEMHFFHSLQQEFKPDAYQITNLYPSDIATSGPNPAAIDPGELAILVRELAEAEHSYYLRDATLSPH